MLLLRYGQWSNAMSVCHGEFREFLQLKRRRTGARLSAFISLKKKWGENQCENPSRVTIVLADTMLKHSVVLLALPTRSFKETCPWRINSALRAKILYKALEDRIWKFGHELTPYRRGIQITSSVKSKAWFSSAKSIVLVRPWMFAYRLQQCLCSWYAEPQIICLYPPFPVFPSSSLWHFLLIQYFSYLFLPLYQPSILATVVRLRRGLILTGVVFALSLFLTLTQSLANCQSRNMIRKIFCLLPITTLNALPALERWVYTLCCPAYPSKSFILPRFMQTPSDTKTRPLESERSRKCEKGTGLFRKFVLFETQVENFGKPAVKSLQWKVKKAPPLSDTP